MSEEKIPFGSLHLDLLLTLEKSPRGDLLRSTKKLATRLQQTHEEKYTTCCLPTPRKVDEPETIVQ
jgi:hypothetical protein